MVRSHTSRTLPRSQAALLLAAVTLVCCIPVTDQPPARAEPTEPPVPADLLEDEKNTIEVFRDASRSVVFITALVRQRQLFSLNATEIPQGSGSGFVWDDGGHIVTNYHVTAAGTKFSVTLEDGSTWPAAFVGGEPNKDLAVLRIEAPAARLRPLPLGDSSRLAVGQKVLAIGNPFGLDHTLTTGVISAVGREIRSIAGTTIRDVIQTDASINPGNSGGPLLDSAGRLVGVNTAILSPAGQSAGIGFAVPVNTVKRVVPQIVDYGHVKRAGLGVSLFTDAVVRRWGVRGAVIRQVMAGTAADRAGLRGARVDRRGRVLLGDVIVGIDEVKVETYDDLFTALDQHEVGDRVTVHYMRDNRRQAADVVLMELEP